jgi:hypothetical protein
MKTQYTLNLFWQLAIKKDDGTTETIDSTGNMREAMRLLFACDDPTAFIDLWIDDCCTGMEYTKSDLAGILLDNRLERE